MEQGDFFSEYLAYTAGSEVPTFFHRWTALAGIGAFLGRDFYFRHGHFSIFPNLYCMLIGNPGTRKSSAIKVMKALLKQAGYTTIAANKTSKEKFMLDLAEGMGADTDTGVDILDQNLWGNTIENATPAECFIMADEFNNFIGMNNGEFISLLTELWDYEGYFENKIKSGKSVRISNPTISILGGNTPTGFSLAFPTDIMGQGFFSRLLLVYGEPNGRRITFLESPDPIHTDAIVKHLQRVKQASVGAVVMSQTARFLLDKIYQTVTKIDDMRFESYYSRRFNHLVKLCLIATAGRCSTEMSERDVVYANTILTHTEYLMPKALGEFGRSKNSDVTHRILSILDINVLPMTFKELWVEVRNDLEKMGDLGVILQNLVAADKIQAVGSAGFLPKKKVIVEVNTDVIDYNFLTKEEKDIRK